eukprot:gene32953-42640_t
MILDALLDINEDRRRRKGRTTQGRLIVTAVSATAQGALNCPAGRADIVVFRPTGGLI